MGHADFFNRPFGADGYRVRKQSRRLDCPTYARCDERAVLDCCDPDLLRVGNAASD